VIPLRLACSAFWLDAVEAALQPFERIADELLASLPQDGLG